MSRSYAGGDFGYLMEGQIMLKLAGSFNASALHLIYEDFDTRLVLLLKRTGPCPKRVITEITEDALLDHPDAVRDMLVRLRALGVGAALDDFGTGYSSLHYLHALPLRLLKIDRAFVEELDKGGRTNSTIVVAAILALAQALNIRVIAEALKRKLNASRSRAWDVEWGRGIFSVTLYPLRRASARTSLCPCCLQVATDLSGFLT
jgi:EAL domain-containing protein (putative c-di-GMP-specific phosphodiesterase class I)